MGKKTPDQTVVRKKFQIIIAFMEYLLYDRCCSKGIPHIVNHIR